MPNFSSLAGLEAYLEAEEKFVWRFCSLYTFQVTTMSNLNPNCIELKFLAPIIDLEIENIIIVGLE